MISMRDPLNAFLDLPQTPVPNAKFGPLAGLTLGVKDIFDVAGYRTGCGNPQRYEETEPARLTAPAVKALLDSGALFIGKTQTEELAFSMTGQNAHFPWPVNPAAPQRVTGGSSSGSAAAVAGGLADIATASDTGGSVRAPASFCGLVGLRTTHGAIPLDGTMPLAASLDTFGWFAKDIETYGKVAEAVLDPVSLRRNGEGAERGEAAGGEFPDPTGLPPATRAQEGRENRPRRLFRLAALDALLLGQAEAAEYERIGSLLASLLGEPEKAPPLSRSLDDLYWCFRQIQGAEAWAAHGAWLSAKERSLGPGVRERFAYGAGIGAKTVREQTAMRDGFRDELGGLLGEDGLLMLPTVPGAAPLSSSSFEALQSYRERALRLLCLSSLSGFPQITVPLGRVDGAPFGISLLGPAGGDRALIGLAERLLAAA